MSPRVCAAHVLSFLVPIELPALPEVFGVLPPNVPLQTIKSTRNHENILGWFCDSSTLPAPVPPPLLGVVGTPPSLGAAPYEFVGKRKLWSSWQRHAKIKKCKARGQLHHNESCIVYPCGKIVNMTLKYACEYTLLDFAIEMYAATCLFLARHNNGTVPVLFSSRRLFS